MLKDVQLTLEVRFRNLFEARRELGYPIYALEHGLSADEIDALKRKASEALHHLAPSSSLWLVWAALGAEAGYRYSGDEYWPELEVRPGEWRANDFRQTLRGFYRRFARDYRGPTPVGRWADHFSIIAWPISHSILPKYLQAHFARHLYDLRHDLSHVAKGDGRNIGKVLFQNYSGSSSRFRDFLQQTDLTTQIVLALRDQESAGEVSRIDPSVLRRIVNDLEKRRDARSYLRDARHLIQSTNVRLVPRLQPRVDSGGTECSANSSASSKFQLVARRLGNGRFAVGLKLPDFNAAGLGPSVVVGQRIRFAGDDERLVPASNLSTLRERKLDCFPPVGVPLVTPDDKESELARFLEPIAKLEERPCWVLRRQANGLYQEVMGAHVRARQDYLLICRAPLKANLQDLTGLAPAQLEVGGAIAYRFNAPDRLDEKVRTALKTIGIGSVTGVVIEPAGLNPNPSQFVPSWLTTEPVILQVSADFDLTGITVSLDGASPVKMACTSAQTYLMLDELEVGRHRIAIAPLAGIGSRAIAAEQFEFDVAAPRPWRELMCNRSGFRMILEPVDASLTELLAGRASLTVVGPLGRSVRWSIEIYDAAGHIAVSGAVGTTRVGDPEKSVHALMEQMRDRYSDALDEAFQVDVVASLEELGRQSHRFPRSVEPIRWKFDPRTNVVRLIDETDHSSPVTISAYALSTPNRRTAANLETALSGFIPKRPGVLLTAKLRGFSSTIFVSRPLETMKDLSDLGVRQSVALEDHQGLSLIRLVDGLRHWSRATPVGHLAFVRREGTIKLLLQELVAVCCGRDFAALLASGYADVLERCQTRVGGSQGFGYRMRTAQWTGSFEDDEKTFTYYCKHYRVELDHGITHCALTLASQPLLLRLDHVEDKRQFLLDLVSNRTLMRGAFLARAASLSGQGTTMKESA